MPFTVARLIMKIFISIAAYRDVLLKNTLIEAYNKADNKDSLVFGVFEQNYSEEALDLSALPFANQIRYKLITPEEARGVSYARQQIQLLLYKDEDYFMQIDSHTLFNEGWDSYLLKNFLELKKYHEKPVLTAYPNSFDVLDVDKLEFNVCHVPDHLISVVIVGPKTDQPLFRGYQPVPYGGFVDSNNAAVNYRYEPKKVCNPPLTLVHGYFIGACFIFADGSIVKDVPYDPYIFFGGEEPLYSVRCWTRGYNIFHVIKLPMYHAAHRSYGIHVLNDHNTASKRETSLEKYEELSQERMRKFAKYELEEVYNPGSVRSLDQYIAFSGIDYHNQTIIDNNDHVFDLDYKVQPI